MKSVTNFIIKPKNNRYNNSKKLGDKELILNTEIFTHQNVSRNAIVIQTPTVGCTDIKQGDEVIVHHNVFRRWKDIKGIEKNSKSFYKDDMYFVVSNQIFAYKRKNEWKPVDGFNFVKPIENIDNFSIEREQPLTGILKYKDPLLNLNKDDLVGFKPNSEYEFIIEGERLYRVPTFAITIKYEYQGNEKEYNPSWA